MLCHPPAAISTIYILGKQFNEILKMYCWEENDSTLTPANASTKVGCSSESSDSSPSWPRLQEWKAISDNDNARTNWFVTLTTMIQMRIHPRWSWGWDNVHFHSRLVSLWYVLGMLRSAGANCRCYSRWLWPPSSIVHMRYAWSAHCFRLRGTPIYQKLSFSCYWIAVSRVYGPWSMNSLMWQRKSANSVWTAGHRSIEPCNFSPAAPLAWSHVRNQFLWSDEQFRSDNQIKSICVRRQSRYIPMHSTHITKIISAPLNSTIHILKRK